MSMIQMLNIVPEAYSKDINMGVEWISIPPYMYV